MRAARRRRKKPGAADHCGDESEPEFPHVRDASSFAPALQRGPRPSRTRGAPELRARRDARDPRRALRHRAVPGRTSGRFSRRYPMNPQSDLSESPQPGHRVGDVETRPQVPPEPHPRGARKTPIAARRRRLIIALAATLCVASWLALAAGLLLGVGLQARLALATAAALSTEALVWISAAMLGLSLFQARRELWHRLRTLPHRLIGRR
jgi:hypothetical protein